ncbi:MAG TPA: CPBP family glutamic-type intramembrane protease [Desulfotignum sp.]|nr:CPBP family glutamic-type intramembrane protease [Desulfotignum sp.]
MKNEKTHSSISNRSLLLPYGVPYFAYVGIAVLAQDRISDELRYAVKLVIVPLLLYWGWKWYVPLSGPLRAAGSVIWGVVFGLAGLVLWLVLLWPFVDMGAEPWSGSAFLLRMAAAAFIVPVFEEIFIRGYIFRVAFQWDKNRRNQGPGRALDTTLDHCHIRDVPPGAWSTAAIVISTAAFTAGHMMVEWPAGVAYSLLMCALWIMRKDLLSCVVAHGVTNLGLALYVYITGQWGFW